MKQDAADTPPRTVILQAQGHVLKTHLPMRALRSRGGGARGAVSGFSPQSRKRMLQQLASLDESRAGFMVFVTLTYPDRDGPPDPDVASRDNATFLKRLKRAFPEASAIWRREWEARKAGDFEGVFYPHFHLLFFNLPFVHYTEVNRIWKEVIGYDGYLRTEIKAVANWKQAFYYVSKYMAKPVAAGLSDAGGPTEEPGGGEAAGSLVYVTYSTGRHWGVFNRKKLPCAESKIISLPLGPWFASFREYAGSMWPPAGETTGNGFTLFVDNPEDFLDLAERLEQGDGV